MTDNTATTAAPVVPNGDDPEYRKELLARAQLMGLTIHPNAKNDTIAAKIAAALADKPDPETGKQETAPKPDVVADAEPEPKAKEIHPAKRLHRVLVSCNDPQKADQTGDILSVSNGDVGNIRFYVHFNKPWHVPHIVLETMKESKLFLHSSRKDGREIITREVPRYNIQYLDPLNDKQRERIAAKQAAALATED